MLSDSQKSMDNSGIRIFADENGAVARLYGRLDIDSSPGLRNQLLTLIETQPAKLLDIDLSAVTHLDSAGLATLIEALRVARAHQIELRLQGLRDQLLRLFEVTG